MPPSPDQMGRKPIQLSSPSVTTTWTKNQSSAFGPTFHPYRTCACANCQEKYKPHRLHQKYREHHVLYTTMQLNSALVRIEHAQSDYAVNSRCRASFLV